jgi:two-component system, OmpR family, KDP operon response regulator KdpE
MQSPKPLVLLIEDDGPLVSYLRPLLAGAGYDVEVAENGARALRIAKLHTPAVAILDLGLPDIDGQQLLLELRDQMRAPIIVLSARKQPTEKIAALDHGADDYLTKPFNSGELLARLRLALRHYSLAQKGDESPVFDFGDLRIDLFDRRVFVGGNEVHLTPIEFKLLSTLVRHVGKVLPYQFLINEVWGPKEAQSPQNVRVFIAGLRRKIEEEPARPRHLITEQGVGYRLLATTDGSD